MPTPKKRSVIKKATGESRTSSEVIKFMNELEHPLKAELETLREIVLGASPEIREGFKWNAPSFRTTEYFATFNLRSKGQLRLVLHTGAKVKQSATTGLEIADPAGLLEWLAKDRCLVTFSDAKDIQAKKPALEALLREWIQWV